MMRFSSLMFVASMLTVSACQMFSGLDRLELKDAGNKSNRPSMQSEPQNQSDASTGSDAKPTKGGMVDHTQTIATDEPDASSSIANAAPDAGVRDAGRDISPFSMLPTNNGGARAPVQTPSAGMDAAVAGAGAPVDAGTAPDASMMMECVPPPPGGPPCTAAPQCGCDKTQNCAVVSDRLTCVTAGSAGENEPCSAVADCMLGYECMSGACLKLCDAAHPDCKGGAQCIQIQSSMRTPIAGANFCESSCNLVDPQRADGELSACGRGLICGWTGTGTRCVQSDRALHRHGEECTDALDCAPGHTCVNDSGTCAKWCASDSDCPSDFTCNTSAPTTVGQKSFGICKPNCLDRTEQVCGLTTQCGCDEAHSCAAIARGIGRITHICRELGPVRNYGSCQYQEDCGRGATCVDETCQPHCLSELECERYASCDVSFYDQAPLIPAVSTCTRPCDPADPHRAHGAYGACSASYACEVAQDGYSYCRSASLRGSVGASCSSNSDCASGNTCSSAGSCVQLCRNDFDCSAGTCRAFATPQHARDVEWGYCEIFVEPPPQY